MTTNFEETSVSRNAKRIYTEIADIDTFEAGVASFTADTTMNLTKKDISAATYKTRINYFDAAGDDKGYVTIYAADKTALSEMASFLSGNEAAETAAGVGGTASRDSADDTWTVRYSCEREEDTFTVTIARGYVSINGFARDETLAAVESWADTVAAFGGTAV